MLALLFFVIFILILVSIYLTFKYLFFNPDKAKGEKESNNLSNSVPLGHDVVNQQLDALLGPESNQEILTDDLDPNRLKQNQNTPLSIQVEKFTKMRIYYHDLQVFNIDTKTWTMMYSLPPSIRTQLINKLEPNKDLSDTGLSDYNEITDGFSNMPTETESTENNLDIGNEINSASDTLDNVPEDITNQDGGGITNND